MCLRKTFLATAQVVGIFLILTSRGWGEGRPLSPIEMMSIRVGACSCCGEQRTCDQGCEQTDFVDPSTGQRLYFRSLESKTYLICKETQQQGKECTDEPEPEYVCKGALYYDKDCRVRKEDMDRQRYGCKQKSAGGNDDPC